jgi:hypothetical protein
MRKIYFHPPEAQVLVPQHLMHHLFLTWFPLQRECYSTNDDNQRNAIESPATGLLIYQTNRAPGFYYYTGTAWTSNYTKSRLVLTGNAGTDPATNFIGTTDAQPLVFKVNNQKAVILVHLPQRIQHSDMQT